MIFKLDTPHSLICNSRDPFVRIPIFGLLELSARSGDTQQNSTLERWSEAQPWRGRVRLLAMLRQSNACHAKVKQGLPMQRQSEAWPC
jgi:hypothetical protein